MELITFLKHQQNIVKRTIIWIMFQNFKMGTLIKNNNSNYYDNNIESKWTSIELIIKDIKIGKF
jgi:hypothetical protein